MEDLCITCVSCVYGALVYQASQCQGPTVQYKRPSCTAPLHLCISAHCKAQCGGGLASRNRAGLEGAVHRNPNEPVSRNLQRQVGLPPAPCIGSFDISVHHRQQMQRHQGKMQQPAGRIGLFLGAALLCALFNPTSGASGPERVP